MIHASWLVTVKSLCRIFKKMESVGRKLLGHRLVCLLPVLMIWHGTGNRVGVCPMLIGRFLTRSTADKPANWRSL